jgi:hypothetical protein
VELKKRLDDFEQLNGMSAVFAAAGTCGVLGIATAEIGGFLCGLFLDGLHTYGTNQLNRAVKDNACLRVRYEQFTGTLLGFYVVNHNSAGNQFCHN